MTLSIRVACVALGLLVLTKPAQAVDAEEVQKAIDRGVAVLKLGQGADGKWPHQEIGATSLVGLTLLECGVPAKDPVVQKAATAVREASIGMTHTYSLALSIMFLDRLGEAADVSLIESMAVRLLAGQGPSGGWAYNCPPIGEAETRRLANLLGKRNELVGRKELPKPGPRPDAKALPPEIQQQLAAVARGQAVGLPGAGQGDNSNTQFATLGLWAARRHGIPVDRALQRVDVRFRTTQNPDGGWAYMPAPQGIPGPRMPQMPGPLGNASMPAMTCAGLLGLGVWQGILNEGAGDKPRNDPGKDPKIQAGLRALGTCIDHPQGDRRDRAVPQIGRDRAGRAYYFLWSLERVAVAFGLDTIGNKDWYAYGAEILLANQLPDGSWRGNYAEGGADTCFALLFLRRANLAADLTAKLKDKIKDPVAVELKSGGVGGGGLKGVAPLKPAIDPNEKTTAVSVPSKDVKPFPVIPGTGKADNDPVAKLTAKLVDAPPSRRDKVLEELRDGEGGEYTQALAGAIDRLAGPDRKKAREALADRLSGLKATTLVRYLEAGDVELRRAAALALALKEDKNHLDRLIDLLNDPEPPVQRGAYAALKSLTGQDFGPAADASRAEHAKAVAAWKAWLKKNGGK